LLSLERSNKKELLNLHPSSNVQIKKYCCPEFVTQDIYTYSYFKKFMSEGSYKIIDQGECKEMDA
jgi:hypothetical protein